VLRSDASIARVIEFALCVGWVQSASIAMPDSAWGVARSVRGDMRYLFPHSADMAIVWRTTVGFLARGAQLG
jgi:hypothetical protein